MTDREADAIAAVRIHGWRWIRFYDVDYVSPDGQLRRVLCPPDEDILVPPTYLECDLSNKREQKLYADCSRVPRYHTDPAADYETLRVVQSEWKGTPRWMKFEFTLEGMLIDPVSGACQAANYEPGDYSRAALNVLKGESQ